MAATGAGSGAGVACADTGAGVAWTGAVTMEAALAGGCGCALGAGAGVAAGGAGTGAWGAVTGSISMGAAGAGVAARGAGTGAWVAGMGSRSIGAAVVGVLGWGGSSSAVKVLFRTISMMAFKSSSSSSGSTEPRVLSSGIMDSPAWVLATEANPVTGAAAERCWQTPGMRAFKLVMTQAWLSVADEALFNL